MNRLACGLACAIVSLALPLAAHASDEKAIDYYRKAAKHWRDPDPSRAIDFAEKALEQAESTKIKANVLLLLGQLHQAKTGDFDQALKYYEQIIRSLIGVKDDTLRKLKAQALLNKGTIHYSERDDVEAALAAYQAGHRYYPTSLSADTLAQLCYRIGRDPGKSEPAQQKQLEYSEKLSREALERDQGENAAQTAKYRLQLAIVLHAQEKHDEAKEVWANTDKDALNANSYYQLAILQALQGKGADVVGETLRKCMSREVRPKARARNQLRKFIRTEPDFDRFEDEASWKDLVTDEAEDGPASRPSK